ADLFASAMLLMAGYCASRLILARVQQRPAERDIDLVHVLMGLAMAGMLVPGITLLGGRSPGRLTPASAHHLPHLMMSGAMMYMLVAVPQPALAGGTRGGAADVMGIG